MSQARGQTDNPIIIYRLLDDEPISQTSFYMYDTLVTLMFRDYLRKDIKMFVAWAACARS